MYFEIENFIAASLYILRFPLAAVAIVFCVLLFRRSRNIGWLCIGVTYLYPFFYFVMRLVNGYHLHPWQTYRGSTAGGVPEVVISFELPLVYLLEALGLYLIYRKSKQEVQP